MSRTFEMLQRLEKEQEFGLSPSRVALAPPVKVEQHNGAKSVRVGDEEVLKLVQRIFRTSGQDAPRLVVFSAVGHGDGATWISTSAATTLAAQGTASICIVDANLRTPSLHNYFGIENRVGWADAISQPGTMRTFAQQIAGSNLWVLPSGSPESAGAISSEGLRSRMADLRNEFDYVLIDAPPANLYADAISLGRLSDGIILVLQSNTTRREAALKAKESFEAANVRLLGAVLNKRTFPIPQNLYDRL
ncbi:MAG TPA: CpsD/CapB family tyrosine-protein kinase [Terriglobales bacterium]|nr:CpsD/CapB family tyrosine-protein kinase [Terriglobales bacterium]